MWDIAIRYGLMPGLGLAAGVALVWNLRQLWRELRDG